MRFSRDNDTFSIFEVRVVCEDDKFCLILRLLRLIMILTVSFNKYTEM